MFSMNIININEWIEANKRYFLPPVCDKLMHESQLKVRFIGGPNVRSDYHIEPGEELFYMVKGDMCLKVLEKGRHKDITIKQGQIFLLPAGMPHSPQRSENSVGLVIDRERLEDEVDSLLFFVGETTRPLFGRCFHCCNLGSQMASIIGEYFSSVEHETGQPIPEHLNQLPVVSYETTTELMKPFSLKKWIEENKGKAQHLPLFNGKHQCDVQVYFGGNTNMKEIDVERWIWQLEGESTLIIKETAYTLRARDSMLIPPRTGFPWERPSGCTALRVSQDRKSKAESSSS